jgi:hypothetical protein
MVVVLAAGCASPRDVRKEFEPYVLCQGGARQVFVATEDTPWKHDVVAALSAALGRDYCVSVENLAALGTVSVSEWDAVVVLSTIYAFGLQSDTAAFLERVERGGQGDRVTMLVTSSISDLPDYGVDAISAASTGNVEEGARSLTPWRAPDEAARGLARLVRRKVE